MKTRKRRSSKTASGPCLCQGAGPVLSELMRRLGPPEPVRQHFDAARIEFLKGLRAAVDARIAELSKSKARGQKINVE